MTKDKEKRWSKKDYETQLNNLQRTCAELDRQLQIVKDRNIALSTTLNLTIRDLTKVLSDLTAR